MVEDQLCGAVGLDVPGSRKDASAEGHLEEINRGMQQGPVLGGATRTNDQGIRAENKSVNGRGSGQGSVASDGGAKQRSIASFFAPGGSK